MQMSLLVLALSIKDIIVFLYHHHINFLCLDWCTVDESRNLNFFKKFIDDFQQPTG